MASRPSLRERIPILGKRSRDKSSRQSVDTGDKTAGTQASSQQGIKGPPQASSASNATAASVSTAVGSHSAIQQPVPSNSASDDSTLNPIKLQDARDALWKRAYEQLRQDNAKLMLAYESLIAAQNNLGNQPLLTPQNVTAVVQKQKDRMQGRQWMYPWFGRTKQVRETVDKIANIVQQSASLISAGMTMAPIYVSLPWSFIAILIPFIMNDSKELQAALDGLEKVTVIMATYTYVEKAYLINNANKSDFEDLVIKVYVSILDYQASAAVYFAKSTMKRLGLNLVPAKPWSQTLERVKDQDRIAQNALRGLGEFSTLQNFQSFDAVLHACRDRLEEIYQAMLLSSAISPVQVQREKILSWICAKNLAQDHFNIEDKIGAEYLGSGTWLLEHTKTFVPWLQSRNGTLLLQGIVGSGKSSLTCMVINHLAASRDDRIAFVYFSSNSTARSQSQNRATETVRQLLKQCAYDSKGRLSKTIEDAFNRSDDHAPDRWDMNLSAATTFLGDVLEDHRADNFVFIIDALDECHEPALTEFLDALSKVKKQSPNLKLFMSSRFGTEVPQQLDPHKLEIRDASSSDIINFVTTEVDHRYERSGFTPEQAEGLKDALIKLSHGMFRWVELEMDIFLPRSSHLARRQMPRDIDARLSKLALAEPKGIERLYDSYDEIWKSALGDEDELTRRQVVKSTMKWILCSVRPFTASALAEAASIQSSGESFQVDEDLILGYCSNFIVKDTSDIVRLSHVSVRQFFESRQADEFHPQRQHQHAFTICMAIASPSVEQRSANHELLTLAQRLLLGTDDFGFYAFFNWPAHWFASGAKSVISPLQRNQLNSRARDFIRHLSNFAMDVLRPTIPQSPGSPGQTEIGLLLMLEDLLSYPHPQSLKHSLPNLRAHLLLLISSQITILNQFNVSSKRLAFLLGAQRFLRLLDEYEEGWIMQSDEGTSLRVAAGNFERLGAVHKFLSADTDVPDLREASRPPADEQRTTTRPKLIFEDTSGPCTLCNFTQWIEGSRLGQSFPFCSTFEEISSASRQGCKICSTVMQNLLVENSKTSVELPITVRVMLDIDCMERKGQDVIQYTLPGVARTWFELCMKDDGTQDCRNSVPTGDIPPTSQAVSLATLIQGRQFDAADISNARALLQECNDFHHCRTLHAFGGDSHKITIPARLIDVGDPGAGVDPRLCVFKIPPDEQIVRFVLLSYTWGKEASSLLLRLTCSSLEDMKNGFQLHRLPKLHQDAVTVCRELGYRYLWIDALCIIQDDHEDWKREAAKMGSYITTADMVFASSTDGVGGGLMPRKRESIIQTFQAYVADNSNIRYIVGIREPVQNASEVLSQSIFDRRWRIQESLLARRLLIFGEEQLLWICQRHFTGQSTIFRQASPLTTLPSISVRINDLQAVGSSQMAEDLIYDFWKYVAEISSRAHMVIPTDALPSIQGIASVVYDLIQGPYQYGHWLDDFIEGLLWIKQSPTLSVLERDYNMPSWSWLRDPVPISYALVAGIRAASGLPSRESAETSQNRDQASGFASLTIECHGLCTLESGEAGLQLSANTTEADRLEVAERECYEYLFDDASDARCLGVQEITFMAFCPWQYGPKGDCRWVGLMLQKHYDESANIYKRCGVFIGPSTENKLEGWERKTVDLI